MIAIVVEIDHDLEQMRHARCGSLWVRSQVGEIGIEKLLIDCYVQVARILMKERAYKSAVEYVRKILLYDPIHEEALEMVDEIRKNRISFRMSEITNARPRVTGG